MLGHSTLAMTRRYVASLNSGEKAAEAHKRFSPVEHLKLEPVPLQRILLVECKLLVF